MNDEIEIIEGEQQDTPEWRALRTGLVTSSGFADAVAAGEGRVRTLYMKKLAGEIVSGETREDFNNRATDRGKAMEPELRALFEIDTGLTTRQVTFVKRKRPYGVIGCSPDSLIGEDSGLEIKSAAPHLLIDVLKSDRVPPEHIAQVQGNMLVTDRPSWWVAIGYRGMPLFKRRVRRDTAYIARLEVGLEMFHEELREMVEWLRNYRSQ